MKNKGLNTIGLFMTVSVIGLSSLTEAGVVPKYSELTLSNGLRVILVEDNRQPMIDFGMVFKVGSSSDSARFSGRAMMTCDMLKEGTQNFPGEMLKSAVDSTGGMIETAALRDALLIRGNFLARDLNFALKVLSDMVIRPQFREKDLNGLKRRAISRFMRGESIAGDRLSTELYAAVYGDTGYGLPPYGKRTGLKQIETGDVRAFYDRNIRPDNAVLVVGGALKTDEAKKTIKGLFSGWEKGKTFPKPVVSMTIPDSFRIILIDYPDAPSTQFLLGRSAAPVGSEKEPALILLQYILGGGGEVSRLWRELIGDQGLATEAKAGFDRSRQNGMIWIRVTTTNEMVAEAVGQVLAVMNDLRTIRISARELEEAKSFARGTIPGYFENSYGTAFHITLMSIFGVELDYYDELIKELEKVTTDELRSVAEEFLDERHFTLVVFGPEDILRRDLSELAPIEVISLGRE
jgi:zinc protease